MGADDDAILVTVLESRTTRRGENARHEATASRGQECDGVWADAKLQVRIWSMEELQDTGQELRHTVITH